MADRYEYDEIFVNIKNAKVFLYEFIEDTEEFILRIKDYMKFRGWDLITYQDKTRFTGSDITRQLIFRKNDNIRESNVSYNNSRRIDTKVAQDIKLTCEEILLELKDEGFVVVVNTQFERFELNHIQIIIANKNIFNYDYLKEYIDRIQRYLEEYNIEFDGLASSIGPVSKLMINPETFETDNSIYVSRFNFKGVKQMKESKVNTLEDKFAILKELSLPLMDAGLDVNISTNIRKFGKKGIYVEIMDNNKIFCKNYPEVDELDWLVNKPIMMEYYDELDHFGLKRDRDYILYGGGLSSTLYFTNLQSKAIKL
jgi:hypothetical protein